MAIATIVAQLWLNLPAFPTYESSGEITAEIGQPRNNSPLSVEEQIREIAKVSDKGDFLVSLAKCESGLDPNIHGGSMQCFHGLYQWNLCENGLPELDHECVHDIECSTLLTMEALDRGEQWRWPSCPK